MRIDIGSIARIVAANSGGRDMTKEQISAFCVDRLAGLLRVPKDSVDTAAKFSRLGLDSAMTVYLLMDLEEKLDLELSPEAFYDHPTVDALSAYLAGKRAALS
ncbi:MAG: acyl carrier protein [Xanthobacteraceae bacterium]